VTTATGNDGGHHGYARVRRRASSPSSIVRTPAPAAAREPVVAAVNPAGEGFGKLALTPAMCITPTCAPSAAPSPFTTPPVRARPLVREPTALGINTAGVAVGWYVDSSGVRSRLRYAPPTGPSATSMTRPPAPPPKREPSPSPSTAQASSSDITLTASSVLARLRARHQRHLHHHRSSGRQS
jgi:hypothetical protein